MRTFLLVIALLAVFLLVAWVLSQTGTKMEYIFNPFDCYEKGGLWSKGWCYYTP